MKLRSCFTSLAICILVVVSTATYADQKSHEKAASTLLDTMKIDKLLSESIDAMLQLQLRNNPSMKPYEDTMKTFFEMYMSGESLRDDFIRLYVESFTEEEIGEITVFYSTPTGQKTLTTAPELMAKGSEIAQKRIMENMSKLQDMIEQEANRISELQGQDQD